MIRELNEYLINFMLKTAGHEATYNDVKDDTWKLDTPWYQYYTMTPEQEKIVKEEFIKKVRKTLKVSKDTAENYWDWWNLDIGLKIVEDNDIKERQDKE